MMIDKGPLGNAFSINTGIARGQDRKHCLSEAVGYAQVFLKSKELNLIERGFNSPAAKVLVNEEGKYCLHIFDHDRGFIPDTTPDEPVVYLPNAALS